MTEQALCTHSWKTCPVHSTGTDALPPFKTVLLCIYGGAETKAGTPFDEHDAEEVADRIAARLWGDDDA